MSRWEVVNEASARLWDFVTEEARHCRGKYGPTVDGVIVADLREVLVEFRRMWTEDDADLMDEGPVVWPE